MWLELVVLALIDLLRIMAIALVIWIGYLLYRAWRQRKGPLPPPGPMPAPPELSAQQPPPLPSPVIAPTDDPPLAKTAVVNQLIVNELRNTLVDLLQGDQAAAARLVEYAWSQYPARSEQWILEKVIHDLEHDRR